MSKLENVSSICEYTIVAYVEKYEKTYEPFKNSKHSLYKIINYKNIKGSLKLDELQIDTRGGVSDDGTYFSGDMGLLEEGKLYVMIINQSKPPLETLCVASSAKLEDYAKNYQVESADDSYYSQEEASELNKKIDPNNAQKLAELLPIIELNKGYQIYLSAYQNEPETPPIEKTYYKSIHDTTYTQEDEAKKNADISKYIGAINPDEPENAKYFQ